MSYAAPTLHVEPTGGLGELFVRVEGVPQPVQLLYQIDDLVDGSSWTAGEVFDTPGLYRVSGFADSVRYVLTALHVDETGAATSPASNLVKARPEFLRPEVSIDLIREDTRVNVEGRTNAFRTRITAHPVRGVVSEIFLYQRESFGTGSETRDVFIAVCKPGDLSEYPASAPVTGPLYRLGYVDLIDRAYDHRDENWNAITSDLDELVEALDYLAAYSVGETT